MNPFGIEQCELHIYSRFQLHHENLLKFIGTSQNVKNNKISLYLVTEYCELGSLKDFIMINTLNASQLIEIVMGISNGKFSPA